MKKHITYLILIALITSMPGCNQDVPLTAEEAREIAREAYIYGFPMVVHYKNMYLSMIDDNSPEYRGTFNTLLCEARLLTPDDRAVVTPNSDTPYCMFWVDIRNEPCVISLPDMEAERFYQFQFIDLYTHNFAYLGTLTTGNSSGNYLVAQSGWKGKVPEGIDQVLKCETGIFFVIVRTQMMDSNDLENVRQIQGEYNLEMLSDFLGNKAPDAMPAVDYPVWNEGDQFSSAAFTYMNVMLNFIQPIPEEVLLRKRIARLGLGTGEDFDIKRFDKDIQSAIEKGALEGFKEIEAFVAANTSDPLMSAKVYGTREYLASSATKNFQLSDHYLMRAGAAHMGLYGNSGAEAIYPIYLADAEGLPLNTGENNYSLTFQRDELPPVKAFWSLSMYDGQTQLFIHNPLDRYLLNSNMMEDFVLGDDGSLTLYIRKDSPGPELENNWLPAPEGPFYAVLRLYGPKETALQGEWINPPMVKTE